VSLEFFLT